MSKTLVIPVIGGLGAGIALLTMFGFFFSPQVSQNHGYCGESVETVKESAPFAVLLPAKLPKAYSLQTVDYVPDVIVTMQYFTRSLCNPNISYSPDEGVIEITEGRLNHVSDAKNGEEYVQREIAKYQARNINATSYMIQDGRMHAIGYWDEAYLNAHLWVVDDKTGTIVKIEARSIHTSLEQLVTIAGSLKEWSLKAQEHFI